MQSVPLRIVLCLSLVFVTFSRAASKSCASDICKEELTLLQGRLQVEGRVTSTTSHDQIYFEQHARRHQPEPEPKTMTLGPRLMQFEAAENKHPSTNSIHIWPYPKSLKVSGPPMQVAAQLRVNTASQSAILSDGISRFQQNRLLSANVSSPTDGNERYSLSSLTVLVQDPDETLSSKTDYSYKVAVSPSGAEVHANSVYGALYGLETILQLADAGSLPGSHMTISDSPDYAWRGVLVDTGRRFVPLSFLESTIDIMSAVKMNVLHLHLSDYGRFAIESRELPELGLSLLQDAPGQYTQAQVKALVAYAKKRGVRVMPEIDLPGHARCWRAAKPKVAFCETGMNGADDTQLFDSNETLLTTSTVLQEILSLFEDDVVHVGGDETEVVGRCSSMSRMRFTNSATSVIQQLNKTALLWEEALFQGGDISKDAIVATWTAKHDPSEVLSRGHSTLNNNYDHSYLNFFPTENKKWKQYYHDIADGVQHEARKRVLGGEVSMWADEYCDTCQCGGWRSQKCIPSARNFWQRKHDEAFSKSFGGMLWPRGFVTAQALWHYAPESDNSHVDRFNPESHLFHEELMAVNNLVAKRGGYVCPSGCDCNEHKACGKFYLPQEDVAHKHW